MTFQRINEIVKTRYETGAYGDAAFRMSDETWLRLKALAGPPTAQPFGRPLGGLLDIPIMIDASLPDGTWQLRDSATGQTLYDSGVIALEPASPKGDGGA